MSNTYKGSIRDDAKFITCNGFELVCFFPDWGWYGSRTFRTAMAILEHEYGPTTAVRYSTQFARDYIANMPSDGFVLTSGQIAYFIDNLDKNNINP
jgi:hypothetical protein